MPRTTTKPTPRPGYTLEQHRELGRLIAGIRDRLSREHTKLGNAYPFGTRAVERLYRVFDQVEELRQDLQNLLFSENKPFDDANLAIYFPPPEERISDFTSPAT